MKTVFLEAPYSGTIELAQETIDHIKDNNYSTIALYASVQFAGNLDIVKKQFEDLNITIITSQPDRTHVPSQLLGCDTYRGSLKLNEEQLDSLDCYLYIGDGKFHPLALVYAQKDATSITPILVNDPMQKKLTLMGIDDVRALLKKYKGSLLKFFTSVTIGVIHTINPGQEQFMASKILEKAYPDKKFYHFIDNVVSFDQLENFNFIDVWVNTTCPRVGFDDQDKFRKGVINLTDAMHAQTILTSEGILHNLQ